MIKTAIMFEKSLLDIRREEHQDYIKKFREWQLKQNQLSNMISSKEHDKALFERLIKNKGITHL